MTLNDLYKYADLRKIRVECFRMQKRNAMSYMDEQGHCYIGIDPFRLESSADEKVKLAHDIGHCETGAFYNRYSEIDIVEKHEYKADTWAIKRLITEDELKEAFHNGYREPWDLADYFNLPEPFIIKALEYYKENGTDLD